MGVQPIGSSIAGGVAKPIGAPYTHTLATCLGVGKSSGLPSDGLRVHAPPNQEPHAIDGQPARVQACAADSKPGIPEEWTSRLDTFLSLLAGFGFRPEHVVDEGANPANWTRRAVHFFPSARYTLIEPPQSLEQYSADLLQRGVAITWINAGVADQSGTLGLAAGQRDSTSTFYDDGDPNILWMSVPVLTLNEIRESHGIPNLLKIDAEGFDLQVLVGASNLLDKTDVFLVEVTVCAVLYENTIADVIRFMDEHRYKVADNRFEPQSQTRCFVAMRIGLRAQRQRTI
jgi:FkbM family methyltransferase